MAKNLRDTKLCKHMSLMSLLKTGYYWLLLLVLQVIIDYYFVDHFSVFLFSSSLCSAVTSHHVQVETGYTAPTMRKHLDRIRFRGQKRDEFADLAESPNTSDTECTDEGVIKPSTSIRESEELREADGEQQSDGQVHKHTCLICKGEKLRKRSVKRKALLIWILKINSIMLNKDR